MKLVTTTFVELSDEERREMRGLRQRSKMTLKEVARRAGVTFQAVFSWESGRPAARISMPFKGGNGASRRRRNECG